jgi:hypothetical protein
VGDDGDRFARAVRLRLPARAAVCGSRKRGWSYCHERIREALKAHLKAEMLVY